MGQRIDGVCTLARTRVAECVSSYSGTANDLSTTLDIDLAFADTMCRYMVSDVARRKQL